MTDRAHDDLGPEIPAVPPVVSPDGYEVLDTPAAGGIAMRGGLIRIFAFGASLTLGAISAPLLVRHLGNADFGRYATVLAVIAIVTGLTEGGVNSIAMRELAAAKDRPQRDRLLSDLLGLRLVLSTVGVVGAVAFSALAGYGETLVLGTLIAGIGMLISTAQTLIGAVLEARLRFVLAAGVEFTRGVVTTALIVAVVLAGGGVLAFLAVVIPAALLSLVMTIYLVRDVTVPRPAFAISRWLPMLRETIVFAIAIGINSLYFRVTLVIMSLIATASQTGDFAVSLRVMEVLIGLPVILIGAAFPIISRAAFSDERRFNEASVRLFELGLLMGTLIALVVTLIAPFAIEIVTGSRDNPATDVLRIQTLALIATFIAAAAGYPLLGLHRHRDALVANLFSFLMVIALAFTLIPSLGAQGAAIAAVAADVVLAALTVMFLLRAGGPRLPLREVPLVLAGGALAYGAAHLLDGHPAFQAAIGAAVYLLLLGVMGRFPPEVREILSRRRAKPPEPIG